MGSRGARVARLAARTVLSAVAAGLLLNGRSAAAQDLDRFTADSVMSIDAYGGQNVSNRPQIVIDASVGVRLGDNWQVVFRPWFRQARPSTPTAPVPDWDAQIYQAGLHYERRGAVATRVDLGEIVSPIGLGMMDWRANLNPTIAPHLTYVVPMPVFDPTIPRQVPVAQSYPLGGVVTVSTLRWDARAAVVNAAPTRGWAIGANNNPHATPVVEAGGGITPVIGLRLGASVAHGQYVTADEVTRGSEGREMTLVSVEGEYAFAYTKLSGEFVRTGFETRADTAVAYAYFLQGMQTLTPRLFAASRYEVGSAPPLVGGLVPGVRTQLKTFEATAGFRLIPELTVRGSFYTRHGYTASAWDQQAAVSLVWARRWR
ncbi:MAG TPA: hypothetical protein VH583_19555 [Vicinamibacterales bacterium]